MEIKDKLIEMFAIQYKSQEKLGIYNKIKDNPALKQQYINQMILACQEELIEIMRETAYKNPEFVPFGWKKQQQFNRDKFKEELVDLWHFVMNLANAMEITPEEFYETYIYKNKVNLERWENDY